MAKAGNIEENVWSYHVKSWRKTAWIAIWLTIILSLTLVIMREDFNKVLLQLLILISFVFIAFSIATKRTTVEINKREATLKKVSEILFFCKSRIYSLHDFNTVKLVERTVAIEEGYMKMLYTLVLEGERLSIEILSTEDENEVKSLYKELDEFLKPSAG